MNREHLGRFGKWAGAGAAGMALVLWLAFAAVNLGLPERASGGTYAATAAMAALSAAGMLSALARRPLLMLGVFLVSFFPVGLYMLGVPSVFRGIGLANVVFLAASLCAFAGKYREKEGRSAPHRGQ